MAFNLLPSKWLRRGHDVDVPVRKEEEHPVYALQREMNRVFDDFFLAFEIPVMRPFMVPELSSLDVGAISPKADMTETEKELQVSVELPGLTEKDVDVSLTSDYVIISGEKKQESEQNIKGWYRMERKYGSFRRVIPLPCEINEDKVEASFENGVLTVTLPKCAQTAYASKSIPIKKA